MQTVFDFQLIKSLISRPDFRYNLNIYSTIIQILAHCLEADCVKFFYFRFTFDAMHAVAGAYATPIFVDKLGASPV